MNGVRTLKKTEAGKKNKEVEFPLKIIPTLSGSYAIFLLLFFF